MIDREETSIKDLSEKLDLNQSNVRQFLFHGGKTISQHNVMRLCDLLGLEIDLSITIKRD